ncbi:carbohydrate ABC transporter permease [Kutzneria buriramensis]|uniref:Cellobiose transport system permease protein n=1 Tax=Kutzneria buriramensis TaxID=1045776 RepID=A0A3E0H265_9PSEU|nr:sugar ABC transporter permease [Kutzneria buriramensis]REH36363.1 cellobiose transport system permease protein [Kutzneria buriramensis]
MTLTQLPARRPESATPAVARRDRWAKLDLKVSPYVYVAPFFVVFAVVGLFPLLYTGYVSLFDWQLGDDTAKFLGAGNYTELLTDAQFWNALANTVSIFLLSSVPQVIVAIGVAALLNTNLRLRTGFRMGVLVPYVASLVAVGIIFGNLFGVNYGLVNSVMDLIGIGPIDWQGNRLASHIAIATMVNWRWTGYNALIVLAAMQAIPPELHEAAMIDGAGPWRRFTNITLPMLRPTITFVVITSTIGGLQIFTEPKLFSAQPGSNTGGSTNQFQTVTLYLYQSAFENLRLGYASAIAWALFLVIVVAAVGNYFLTRRLSR